MLTERPENASGAEFRRPFLTGEWRHLAMLNYRVDPAILAPFVPRGTVLDTWHGVTYVSVVGFLFRETRVLGIPVPRHRSFEEVNLRFYVRREERGAVKRGVTFIKEIVPRRAIALVAKLVYNEPYVALPMRHALGPIAGPDRTPARVEYRWRQRSGWSALAVEPSGPLRPIETDSEE